MNYTPDDFGELDVLRCLDNAGLKHRNMSRYILTQCPTHDDKNPSAQIYKDDFFVNCHSGCGRYHITKAFPELIGKPELPQRPKMKTLRTYEIFDLMEYWQNLPLIPRDHTFKGLPLETLDFIGWRFDPAKNSYFIPYFSRSRMSVPFGQWRHLSGERRFTFLAGAKPTCYGTWNLHPGEPVFIVEGASDAAILDFCAVPWVALPSAASVELIKEMGEWCIQNNVKLVYAGDKDEAGDRLKDALGEIMHFRICQPPDPYKDWGEFFEAKGQTAVVDRCFRELFSDEFLASQANLRRDSESTEQPADSPAEAAI